LVSDELGRDDFRISHCWGRDPGQRHGREGDEKCPVSLHRVILSFSQKRLANRRVDV
jgi:hypothetical protein